MAGQGKSVASAESTRLNSIRKSKISLAFDSEKDKTSHLKRRGYSSNDAR
jgi:hypothetical protein